MSCIKCGAPTDFDEPYCNECRKTVRVLSPEEREHFEGITISQPGKKEEEYQGFDFERGRYGKRIYLAPTGILAKIILGLAAVALLAMALPLALFFMGIIIVVWVLNTLMRR